MIINNNMSAMNAHRQLGVNQGMAAKAQEKLSSGLRINKAGDDAAGLAISEKMRAQVRGLDQASRNAQDGISMIQTAEGALNETQNILQRMRELAVQAENGTNTDSDKQNIQDEINSLTSEINRIGNTTQFNGQNLIDGSKDGSAGVTAQAGSFSISSDPTDLPESFEIAGKTFTKVADNADASTGSFSNAAELVAALNHTNGLGSGLSAAVGTDANSDKIIISQTQGNESATAPTATGVTLTTEQAGVEGKAAGSGSAVNFQIGANENQSLSLNVKDMRAAALGISTAGTGNEKLAVTDGTSSTTTEQALDVVNDAGGAITKIQSAIDKVSNERSNLGANQNRLEHTISNLDNASENLQSAESRIRDVDMAKEIMEFTKQNILSQASQSMLAQANQAPQQVLQLLG